MFYHGVEFGPKYPKIKIVPGKVFNLIAFKYQTVGGMGYLYDYLKENE